jgi:hypothetical protein
VRQRRYSPAPGATCFDLIWPYLVLVGRGDAAAEGAILVSMPNSAEYLHLRPGSSLPPVTAQPPFRAILVVDAEAAEAWQAELSNWLVRSGCLYMMAWGSNCSSWDDSVDVANIGQFEPADIPEEKFVMTTWHADQPLSDVFWFSRNCASHPVVELERTVVIHIADESREKELLKAYLDA